MYKQLLILALVTSIYGCSKDKKSIQKVELDYLKYSENILDYRITPRNKFDKDGLIFSDQGAWFGYSLPDSTELSLGFSGPFLMTQQNGVWGSKNIAELKIKNQNLKLISANSYSSHLVQTYSNNSITVNKQLTFLTGNTSLIKTTILNTSNAELELYIKWENQPITADSLNFKNVDNKLTISSTLSSAIGFIKFPINTNVRVNDSTYSTNEILVNLEPNETKSFVISHTFIFPEYSWKAEQELIESVDFDSVLIARKDEKNNQIKSLISKRKPQFQDSIYGQVLAKTHITLQNNWRVPAGEIKHEGLFPSYHYVWFNGFWSWDSWKHAVGLSHYDIRLAKEQVKLMFDFQNDDGFVADVVYRDTTIEAHNYRDTKPPLSAWAVSKIYEKDQDIEFVKYMYPKLKKYHYWWYNKRDHDQDGICEYGSTDGSLVAAKWESGMDNAIRFDNSKILKNSEGAYSLDQESVDLNAYLYAEKLFLADLASYLNLQEDQTQFTSEAQNLKIIIQSQFYDSEDGWFYDTTLDGSSFIKGEGSEGWTALWAEAATPEQAKTIKTKMMNPDKFYTKMPFQTMSADHEKFDPLKGYWRGPNWLDQAYFGVKGLRNYGYDDEADLATIQILKGAEGLLEKGQPIRENYHPLTGEGLHAKNFSWSAAHIIMMLLEE